MAGPFNGPLFGTATRSMNDPSMWCGLTCRPGLRPSILPLLVPTEHGRSEVDLGTELVPNYLRTDQFYLRLFVAAHRCLTGERRHLFW